MKNLFWWMWLKDLFSKPVTEPKEMSPIDRRVADYHKESLQRMADSEQAAKQRWIEAFSETYKESFKKTPMFLVGHRPNPVYLKLLAIGFPDITSDKITDMFYKISEESELVAQKYLETPGVVDVPTPVYDNVLLSYQPKISFMGDIYPMAGTPAHLIQMYGVWTIMHKQGN